MRLGGRGRGLPRPLPGGLHRVHQGALPAGSLPAARTPEGSPPLGRALGHQSRGRDFLFGSELVEDLRPLDPRGTVRRLVHFKQPSKLRPGAATEREPAGQAGWTERVCRPGVNQRWLGTQSPVIPST